MPEAAPDLVVRGALVVDGTGAPGRTADVAVAGDRIAVVGDVPERGGVEVDGRGLVLAPGFVDVHTHDDFAVVATPEMAFKVMQGVTTDVVGNCGHGPAPFEAASALFGAGHLAGWSGHAGYVGRLAGEPPALNVALLVGHGTLRRAAMGLEARPPMARELAAMRTMLEEGLDAGGFGLSTGLIYEPARHAAADEIVALARPVAERGLLYATHMRNEGPRLLEAVEEALDVGRETGVSVQISHHKASGRDNWGRVERSLALLEEARASGLDVLADQYPYTAGSTLLGAVVSAGALEDGEGSLGRLEAADVVIASSERDPALEGRTLAQIAAELGDDPLAAAHRLLARDPGLLVVVHTMSEADVRRVMVHPTTMIGSDGIPAGSRPHPRLYGTFARVLGTYARDLGLLGLEAAVHKMTGLPARKFRLDRRGVIAPGCFADLVLFDFATVADRATYDEPRVHPAGIRHVLVNGRFVARDGEQTGARPGRPLRPAA